MLSVIFRRSIVVAGTVALLLGPAPAAGDAWAAAQKATQKKAPSPPEGSPRGALLKVLNTATEEKLRATPGLTPPLIEKLLAHRAAGGKFKNLQEFAKTTGATPMELHTLLQPFLQADALEPAETSQTPAADPASRRMKAGGQSKPDAPSGDAAPGDAAGADTVTGTGPIGAVRPGFYSKLPGYDNLDTIDPLKKTEFLETINREMCLCGCKGETLAYCLVNDPGCPVVKARVKKIYDDILTKAPR